MTQIHEHHLNPPEHPDHHFGDCPGCGGDLTGEVTGSGIYEEIKGVHCPDPDCKPECQGCGSEMEWDGKERVYYCSDCEEKL